MLIDIFDLNKKSQKSHDFFKKVMIFASPEIAIFGLVDCLI